MASMQLKQRAATILVMLSLAMVCDSKVVAEPTDSGKAQPTSVGKKLDAFAVTDYRGRDLTEADFVEAKYLVVAFLGVECPLAKLYSERLQQIQEKYQASGLVVLGIDANQQDSLAEMAAHARRHSLTFSFAKDNQQALLPRWVQHEHLKCFCWIVNA